MPVGASLAEARALASLDQALSAGFRTVAGVGLAGYAAAFAAALWSNVGRKRRAMALAARPRRPSAAPRPRFSVPVIQAAAIAVAGCVAAIAVTALGARLLDAGASARSSASTDPWCGSASPISPAPLSLRSSSPSPPLGLGGAHRHPHQPQEGIDDG